MSEDNSQKQSKTGRWFYAIGTLIFLVYTVWIIGPYFRSIIVRDAAVTSWINIATAPITGTISTTDQFVAGTVGSNGIIAEITNNRLSRRDVVTAQTRYDNAIARRQEFQGNYRRIVDLEKKQIVLFDQYANAFRKLLADRLANVSRELITNEIALKVARKTALEREQSSATKKKVPQPERDEAQQIVWKHEVRAANLSSERDNIRIRIEAANNDIFFTADGNEPAWASGRMLDVHIRKHDVVTKLQQVEAEITASKVTIETALENFSQMSRGVVEAPAGSIVWRKMAAPGATVLEGERLADWLDCSVLMIDVPIDDAEISLIRAGMEAEVLLEGDITTRKAAVLLTRGSAFTLDNDDLAAIAKGRGNGTAQVLLEFSHEHENFDECPVGRAAYVDFPDVGILDVIRARLRF